MPGKTHHKADPRPALTAGELAAGIRFVARHALGLAVALVWAICKAPQLVAEMARVKVRPTDLAILAETDKALDAVVRSSADALILRGRAWASGLEEAASISDRSGEE